MNRIKQTLIGLAVFALLGCFNGRSALAQLPPDNVAGNWTIYSRNIDDGAMVTKFVQIVQNGTQLTGYFQGPNQAGGITGHVDIHHIEFSTETRNVLTFHGVIDGNSISGMYGLHGRHAEWSAVREGVPETVTISTTTTTAALTPAPSSSDQLDSLVAPIALYPDNLVAQVLAAATFPEQVAVADLWMTQNSSLIGTALMQAVDQQQWDNSVKGLTQFPAVLHMLASNLTWTSSLGQAFETQQSEVMAAVQVMRAKAQSAGTLQSNTQVTVTQQSPSTIVIQPANPATIYVPQYNPAVVYGAPVVVPMYTAPVGLAAGISFGAGVAVGEAIGGGGFAAGGFVGGGGGGFAWGWHSWGCNWGGGGGGSTIIYNHNTYIHNNTYINNHNTWNHNNNWNGYHPWGPGPHGDGPYGPHPYTPNGGRNGDHGLIGGNGGVEHPVPNGGHNGDHGLIGGNGGVEHGPDGGRNGDHGLIGGNGGVQRPAADYGDHAAAQHNALGGATQHPDQSHAQTPRPDERGSRMSGNGNANRTESNRGRSSMNRPRPQHPQHVSHPHPAPHASAPHRR